MRKVTIAETTVRLAGGPEGDGGGDGPLVVLLHGFGAPGDDLVPLHRELDVPSAVRFAFPEAPLDLGAVVGPGYAGARAWWMIDPSVFEDMARGVRRDRTALVPEGLTEARERVGAVLEGLGATPERTVLGGFSQGAMLTLDVALRAPSRFAGLALMSGTLIAAPEWQPLLPKLSALPIVQSHGRADPILPFDVAERLRELLRGANADLRWVEFAGGHTIVGSVLDAVGRLARDVFEGA